MLSGLHSAAAGMQAQQRRMDSLSNDIANANTAGYKHERVAFRDLLATEPGLGAEAGVQAGAGAAAASGGRGFGQGALQVTGGPLDVAMQGPGFLQVRSADGQTRLTRDGSLHVDAGGRLMTSGGRLLQPPVTLPKGVSPQDVTIAPDGRLNVDGRVVGSLTLVTVASPESLRSAGDNLYEATAQSGAARAAGADTTVAQGALEASNVDMGDAMVDLIDSQRSFQMASQALKTQDEMWQIANGLKS